MRRLSSYADLASIGDCTVFFAKGEEERSRAIEGWETASAGSEFVPVSMPDDFTLRLESVGDAVVLGTRDRTSQRQFWSTLRTATVVLDITGLSHTAWATLLRGALEGGCDVLVTYAEPREYSRSDAPTEGQIFDLSEKIAGIRPIPGFAYLGEGPDRRVCVPLLGFEGTRFLHLVSVLQPAAERVIPVIGVPGFRMEYPFHSYRGNKIPLLQTEAWKECRFAAANCPFSALYVLEDIQESLDPLLTMAVSPIGTKPHALGAMLFYMTSKHPVEIVYDHPVRKRRRTTGATTVSLFDLRGFEVTAMQGRTA